MNQKKKTNSKVSDLKAAEGSIHGNANRVRTDKLADSEKAASLGELQKLDLHPESWQLARLVALSTPPGQAVDAHDLCADDDALVSNVSRALRLLHICDFSLRDSISVNLARYAAITAYAGANDNAHAEATAAIAASHEFKHSLQFEDGRQVMPLDKVPLIVLRGKRWDKDRERLWMKFLKERIHNRENWGITEQGYIEGHMADSLVHEFHQFTVRDRQNLTLKNRRGGAKKARRKIGK